MGRISLIRLIKQGLNLHLISGTFVHDRTPSRRQQIPKTRCANARIHHNRKAQAMNLAVLRPDTFPHNSWYREIKVHVQLSHQPSVDAHR